MAQRYGIKVKWDDGVETFMTRFAEYSTNHGDIKIAEYASAEEATGAAQNMQLKNYRVVPIDG
jgi:hypothetical protein